MRRILSAMLVAIVCIWGTAGALSQDEAKSDKKGGELLPGPFQAFNATGPYAGRPHCLVCQYGLHPVALVFARDAGEPDGPVLKLVKALDDAVEKNRAADLHSFTVFLNDDVENVDSRRVLVKRLQDLAEGLKLKHVVLALDRAAGPKDYNLSKEIDVTVLLYHDHKIANKLEFKKDTLNDEGIKSILDAVGKMLADRKREK